MLSRRLIRIKVFKILFGKVITGDNSYIKAENELIESCERTLDLYYFLLALPIEVKKIAKDKIDSGLKKFHPKPEEINPNMKFLYNKFIQLLENDDAYQKIFVKRGLSWADYRDFVRSIYNSLVTKDYYKEYMESESESFDEDVKFIKRFFEEEFEDNEYLEDLLEETSAYWMDDLDYVLNYLIGSIDNTARSGKVTIPETFLKIDDKEFAKKLLTKSMVNYDEYSGIVAEYIPNWDLERLVNTDLVLIVMGMTEAINFDSIPIKVTINEYVEISKFYSTINSKVFVNGLLDKILQQMVKDGKIVKSGRGLVGGLGDNKENK